MSEKIARKVIHVPILQFANNSYREFATGTVFGRVLPQTDGMIPVKRRILLAMFNAGSTNKSEFTKATKVVGDTMGSYHPHGDSSIVEALETIAQPFKMNVPLVDVYGSVGQFAGDAASAPRYWEARPSIGAMELLLDLKEHGINESQMHPNYTNDFLVPDFLPVRFPVSIVNYNMGATTGFKTMTAPHNPTEVMLACRALLRNPDMSLDEMLTYMPAPDFPSGGTIYGKEGIREYYETGKGRLIIRANYRVEHLPGGKTELLFYELPFLVSPKKIIEQLNDDKKKKRGIFSNISKSNNFTDRKNGQLLSVVTKPGANYQTVLDEIFKNTDLEKPITFHNTQVIDGYANYYSMLDILRNFINLRFTVNVNKAQYRINEIDKKVNELSGVLSVLIDLDKAVRLIRNADNENSANMALQQEFKLNEEQATYILAMRLRRLTGSDSLKIQQQIDELLAEKDVLVDRLEHKQSMIEHIDGELSKTAEVIGGERKSVYHAITEKELNEQKKDARAMAREMQKNSETTIYRLANGWVVRGDTDFVPNYPVQEQFTTTTRSQMLAITQDGMGYKVPVSFLPLNKSLQPEFLGIHSESPVVALVPINSKKTILIATVNGVVKRLKMDIPNGNEFPVITLKDDDYVINAHVINQEDDVVLLSSSDSSTVVFPVEAVGATGHKSAGVGGIKLRPDCELVAVNVVQRKDFESSFIMSTTGSTVKLTSLSEFDIKSRNGVGVRSHAFRSGENMLTHVAIVSRPYVVMAETLDDNPTPIANPALAKRDGTGIKIPFPVLVGEKIVKNNNEIEEKYENL